MARSNRQLTQFAVDTLKGYFMTDPVESKVSAGNTELECQICRRCPYAPPQYVVNLFGKQIVRIYTSPLNHQTPIAIMISTGDFYDSKGRPSRTTRERGGHPKLSLSRSPPQLLCKHASAARAAPPPQRRHASFLDRSCLTQQRPRQDGGKC